MKTLDLIQGSPEWLAVRAKYFTASEAPAMLGMSKYKTRQALLREKATGITPEVDERTQRLFDKGHEAEEAARSMAEEEIGEELYPLTGAVEIDGLPLLASFDGITMGEDAVWENKMWNEEFADFVGGFNDAPDTHWPQLEQQIIVSGATRTLFTVSDGSVDKTVKLWYVSRPERRAAVLAGWKQFAIDVADYQHIETVAPAVAAVVKDLPAVMVQVSGQVSIIDNFSLFETALRDFIDNRLVRKPQNDQDFADLGEQIASLKKAESALDAAEVQMLSQVESVDAMKRTKDMLHKLARGNRLVAEKLLAAEKENRKAEIVRDGQFAFQEHVQAISDRLNIDGVMKHFLTPKIADAIKGLKSLDSMRDKASVAMANAKIEASATADRIECNRKVMEQLAGPALFPDFASVCTKAPDDFAALIVMRVSQQKAADEARLESGRAKIRAEEQAKAQRESNEEAAAERAAHAAEAARIATEVAASQKVIDDVAAEAKRAADAVADRELHELAAQRATVQASEYAEQQRTASVPVIAVEQPTPVLASKWLADLNALAGEMTDNEGTRLVHYGRRLISERQVAA